MRRQRTHDDELFQVDDGSGAAEVADSWSGQSRNWTSTPLGELVDELEETLHYILPNPLDRRPLANATPTNPPTHSHDANAQPRLLRDK